MKAIKFLKNIDYFLQIIFMLILLFAIILQILSRIFINFSTPWTLEVISMAFAAMVWFAIGIGIKEYSHIGITFCLKNASLKVQKIIFISHLILFLFLILFIMYFSSNQLIYYYHTQSKLPASGIPYYLARSPIFLGSICTVYRILEKIFLVIKNQDKHYHEIFSDNYKEEIL